MAAWRKEIAVLAMFFRLVYSLREQLKLVPSSSRLTVR